MYLSSLNWATAAALSPPPMIVNAFSASAHACAIACSALVASASSGKKSTRDILKTTDEYRLSIQVNPTAPMPSFSGLQKNSPEKFDALVAFVSQLKGD